MLDGPPLDVTVQDPSHAWAAGGMVSNLQDLAGFFRALLVAPDAVYEAFMRVFRALSSIHPSRGGRP